MNPRGVRHPDQTVLQEGSVRIILSLRAVGEGHISTIAFREGTISPGRELTLAPQPTFATTAMLGVHQVGNQVDRISVHCDPRSEEHTSELQSLMRISYAVFCLKKKHHTTINQKY